MHRDLTFYRDADLSAGSLQFILLLKIHPKFRCRGKAAS
jgi:hypothetical protein